ncbi:MAG TPA: GNAT family N-acetyltransferase [Steroidobacteraceae bacterium]|nr:GNAT family N-acetyltransferase [Steroidobacteraceae bacterium]
MKIDINDRECLPDFIRLNELWITAHFSIEDADRALALSPGKVIDDGGFVFSLKVDDRVVGVCALFKESATRYQLARMAVEPALRGRGYGHMLMEYVLETAKSAGAESIYLMSNTALQAAISLYERFGFVVISRGQHPVYARCNIVLERQL